MNAKRSYVLCDSNIAPSGWIGLRVIQVTQYALELIDHLPRILQLNAAPGKASLDERHIVLSIGMKADNLQRHIKDMAH